MKPKFKDYYGNPLRDGIYFIADKSESKFCKIILDEDRDNFLVYYEKYSTSPRCNLKRFAKNLIPFKDSKANLEWTILNLSS